MSDAELEAALADMTDQRDRLLKILDLALREPAARRIAAQKAGVKDAIVMVEKAFLGSILSMPALFTHVKYKLLPSHFFLVEHGNVWEALSRFIAANGTGFTTTWLLAKDMEPTNKWAVVALSALLDHAILDELDIPLYAKAIRDASIARRIK